MSSRAVPVFARYAKSAVSYTAAMNRPANFDWYLPEWIETMGVKPADFRTRAGWSKRKMSELINGQMRYNRDVVNEAASVLNVEPFELLLRPDEAMAMRQMRSSALRIAAESRREFTPEPPEAGVSYAVGQ